MEIIRTRFGRDIVAEVAMPPQRHKKGDRVIIFCPGVPSVPSKRTFLEFFAKKGFVVIFPRYRGTWESGGTFLRFSPEKDVLDVIGAIGKDFYSLERQGKKRYKLNVSKLYLIGSSFGGPAVILASRNKQVNKAVLVAPVVDWTAKSKTERLDGSRKFLKEAFGEGYRVTKQNWNKLKGGKFYNPMYHVSEIDGSKLFIIHAKDDKSVHWKQVERFAKKTGSKLLMLKRGGHLSSHLLMRPAFYKRVDAFFKN